jgi:hypothetical protein
MDCTLTGVLRACLAAIVLAACTRSGPPAVPSPAVPPLAEPPVVFEAEDVETILRSDDELASWLADPERHRVEVLLAVPNAGGSLDRSGFRADREYFYPASTVKLCAAFAALEKLGELAQEHGESVSPSTKIRFVSGQGRSRRAVSTSVGRDIEQALVVSDNDAFNRLLDFVGPEELAERLARRGITSAHVAHHLGDVSAWSLPTIELLLPNGAAIPVGQRIGFPIPAAPSVALGRAYRNERGRLVPKPMDFATKNFIPLRELQELLVGIMRPELAPDPAAWEIPFRPLLVETLGQLPGGALDARYKPLAVAIASALPDRGIRVYGKSGRAYGFAVENAYVTSEATGRSFFVAATIYANGNDVMNDDRYEYDAVADPFVARLGVVLAQHLLLPKSSSRVADGHDEDR